MSSLRGSPNIVLLILATSITPQTSTRGQHRRSTADLKAHAYVAKKNKGPSTALRWYGFVVGPPHGVDRVGMRSMDVGKPLFNS